MLLAHDGQLDPDVASLGPTKQAFLILFKLIQDDFTSNGDVYLIDQGERGPIRPAPLYDHDRPVKRHFGFYLI